MLNPLKNYLSSRFWLPLTCAMVLVGCATGPHAAAAKQLKKSLVFHAGFDGTTDASFGAGDRRLQVGVQWGKPRTVAPGLPPGNTVHLAPGQGRFGDALQFEKKIKELVCYPAEGNIAYQTQNWSGTVSYWLKVNPEKDLAPGYCDTIQITPKDWNDASFFTEFTPDDKPRHFRLGMYADLPVWNPKNRDWEKMPMSEKPLIVVERPPFGGDRWTHVVITWDRFNTGQANGIARLYLNGQLAGQMAGWTQTYTWNLRETRIMLGLSYTGLMDDLSIFNRALSAEEVGTLNRLPRGVAGLH